jgi:hypothetical protein
MNSRAYDMHILPMIKHIGYTDWWLNFRRKQNGGGITETRVIGKYRVEYEDGDYPNLFIWNLNSPCVAIGLSKHDKVALLSRLVYDPTCTIDGKMKRGEGTIEMLEFAFKIAKKYGAEKILLSDKSTFKCNGEDVDLGLYSLMTYGKTWYERKFGFRPIEADKSEFEEVRSKLPRLKHSCEFYIGENGKKISKEYGLDVRFRMVWEKLL